MSGFSDESANPNQGGSIEDPISLDSSDGEQGPFPAIAESEPTPDASTVTLAGDSPPIKEEEQDIAGSIAHINDGNLAATERESLEDPVLEDSSTTEKAVPNDKIGLSEDPATGLKETEVPLESSSREEPLVAEGEKPESLIEKDVKSKVENESISASDPMKSKVESSSTSGAADASKAKPSGKDPVPSKKSDLKSEALPEDPNTPRLAETITASKTDKPYIYLITSFTSPMRHMISATNRLELILKENDIPFQVVDAATNEKAKKVWRRYGKGKVLPGVLRDLDVVGNYQDIDDANEGGEVVQLVYDE